MAQTSTIPALQFFRTGNGLQAYLLPTGLAPLGLTYVGIDRQADYLLGRNADNTALVTVDLKTRHILRTWSFAGWYVMDVVLDPQSGWVAAVLTNGEGSSSEVLVFNARTHSTPVQSAYPPSLGATGLVVDVSANRLFVASWTDVEIYTLQPLHRPATIPDLQYNPGSSTRDSYVNRNWDSEPIAEDSGLGQLIIINPAVIAWYGMALIVDVHTGRVLTTVRIGQGPTAVQVDAQLHRAYITNSGSHDVTILDTHTGKQVALVGTGTDPVSLALDTASGEGFTANSSSNTVTLFPLTTQGAKAAYPPPQP